MGNRPSAGGTPATGQLASAGVEFTVHVYCHTSGSGEYGMAAASELGRDSHQVFKTLIIDAGGRLGVGVVSVADQLDLKAFARALGAKRSALVEPARACRSSGYVLGGISPFGQRTPLPTVLDQSAENFATIFVSGGRRGVSIELAPADLVKVLQARVAEIRR